MGIKSQREYLKPTHKMFHNSLFDDFYYQPRVYRQPRYTRRHRSSYYEPTVSGLFDPFYQQVQPDPRFYRKTEIPEEQEEIRQSTPEPVKIKINHTQTPPESSDSEISNSDSETSNSDSQTSVPSEASLPTSVHSENHEKIVEIAAESEKIEEGLAGSENLEDKAVRKRLRYAAENQYKLIERLDALSLDQPEDKVTRKQTIKEIQKRLDTADQKLNESEEK